jgi:acetyl esterase/lipase
MGSVEVRDESFTGADGEPLPMRVYGTRGPSVVILEGYPDAGVAKHVGCSFMDYEWAINMAQLIAASGMTAITHSNRDPSGDAKALLDHLSATGNKVGIWSCSGHGPVVLEAAPRATAAVLINPITQDFCPEIPLFVVRAGNDETPGLNAALDGFVARAIAANRPLTFVNYPEAPHAFDLFRDAPETRRILQQGLDFLRAHLV